MDNLKPDELISLIKTVFPGVTKDDTLGILVDIPRRENEDNSDWRIRRKLAESWYSIFFENKKKLGIKDVSLIGYPCVGSNNADLPGSAFIIKRSLPDLSSSLEQDCEKVDFNTVFKELTLILAPTEFSTTAPLKNAAAKFNFRAATMPGFSPLMIPALRIDYGEVFRRVKLLKDIIDTSEKAEILFIVDNNLEYNIDFDLRFRKSHMSSGRFPEPGVAGNLPSGETYIVPYEGERSVRSETKGTLPVQIGNDILFYTIVENKAIEVLGGGESYISEERFLRDEPAYGNMAELGFGVLGDFGLNPINEILLDEKLGFHIAFGRSDHFGGNVGPDDFSAPEKVIHLDRVYIPQLQPRISLKSLYLVKDSGKRVEVIRDNSYLIFK